MKRETQFKRCPGSLVFMQPKPDMVPCAACGTDTEIWSDEAEGVCPACGATVVRFASQSCVDWCKHARECLGEDKYKQYGAMKAALRKHALLNALEKHFGKDSDRVRRSRKVAGYAELILAEEPIADPNVVFAAATMLYTGEQDLPADHPAQTGRQNVCLPVVQEIMKNLGYYEDFVLEVCGIIERREEISNDINFRIVHDAEHLAISEKERIPAGSLPDAFLDSFRTETGRRLAQRGVLIAKDSAQPS